MNDWKISAVLQKNKLLHKFKLQFMSVPSWSVGNLLYSTTIYGDDLYMILYSRLHDCELQRSPSIH